MKLKDYSFWFTIVGVFLILSFLVFSLYFFSILFMFEYGNLKINYYLFSESNCVLPKLLNSSNVDFQQCVQSINNGLAAYPSYLQMILLVFSFTSLSTWLFFLPLILGVILLALGYYSKKKK